MEEDRTKVASLSTKPMSCILSVAEDCGVCISVYLYICILPLELPKSWLFRIPRWVGESWHFECSVLHLA